MKVEPRYDVLSRMPFLFGQKEEERWHRLIGGSPWRVKGQQLPHFFAELGIGFTLYQTGWFGRRDDESKQCRLIITYREDKSEQKSGWESQKMANEEWCMKNFSMPKSLLDKIKQTLLVEGAGLLPHLVRSLNVQHLLYYLDSSLAIFKKNIISEEWVPYVLKVQQAWSSFWKPSCNETFLLKWFVGSGELGSSLVTNDDRREESTAEEDCSALKLSNKNK